MPHVVTEPCLGTKNAICVTVCPVEAFREDKDCLYIDPDECIDCGACVPECPVNAIFEDKDVPEKWRKWIEINTERSKKFPVIS